VIYNPKKLVKFPSWVGIVPVNWFVLKSLFFVREVKYVAMAMKIIIWYDYKITRLEKFPNSVRIVPESWLSLKYLYFFFFLKGEWFLKRKERKRKRKKRKKVKGKYDLHLL